MSRPEPCVLFAQTFVHPHLDEYVDEVLFAEPVVVTACEFLEQNASSASPGITLVGATSPPSFALEVFVQCEGEPRFRRLGQPFLYSHSSSNVLEVEMQAEVTNHLAVRGSYRSLSLVVYGNTAEDLGQFNIEFDLDSSLANLVSSPSEGKLEDLPPALRSNKLMLEESITPLKLLALPRAGSDPSPLLNQFIQLIVRFSRTSDHSDVMHEVIHRIVSAISSYVTSEMGCTAIAWSQRKLGDSVARIKEFENVISDAENKLQELNKLLQYEYSSASADLLGLGASLDCGTEVASTTTKLLPDLFNWYHLILEKYPTSDFPSISKNKIMIVGLGMALLLCSGQETCYHFLNGGGMEQLGRVFHDGSQKSTVVTLMLLGVIERATQYAIGCEGYLGWWPREDENVPMGSSEGYNQILRLLLQKQGHDIASLATYILHRLRSYEVASRYESAVLSLLGCISSVGAITNVGLDMLVSAKLQLKQLLKLLNSCGPVDNPSPVAQASRSLILGQSEDVLSYKATINLIASSSCDFSDCDIDPHVLSLLKERGFLPLSAALLSSTILRSEKGHTMRIFVEIASLIEAILLSLLLCRSGSIFLLLQPEVTFTLIHSLEGVENVNKECVPLRYASILISKGFFCCPQDVGLITKQHLTVVSAIDRLLTSTPQSEELLWVLWELCGISRSDSGRQALLTLGHFPEAVLVLMEALKFAKELEPLNVNNGASPLNLAIFHSAAELFEVIITDPIASSLGLWIGHAVELHKALHSSSPGSNRKDAPTRLLEWVDAGLVYQKSGATGLLHYAAVLASDEDAHHSSASIHVDSMDVENVGDFSSGSDIQGIESRLGKLVSDKDFEGVNLRASSIAQLTTTFRILSFISENSSVAAALYEEGAVTLIYVVLFNCKFMLQRSSNTYDYLVDEGAECNYTSDLLLERGREQSLVDLMVPALVLLIALLHKLQVAKEQHRNTKLLNALLSLHREVSPKLAACVADVSSPYPASALGLGAVCHLIVSAIACWPAFGWTPGLFQCLLDSVQATSSLALGPKEACSLLSLLGDLFPVEGIRLWTNGMPSLSALRTLAIGTLLGPQKETVVDWYTQPGHVTTLLSRLTPVLDKIAQIILHFAFTALVVVQDMLRVFIVRIACQNPDSAVVLLRPIFSWIHDHVSELSPLSDMNVFKVYRLLNFITSLLEHSRAKTLLLKQGVIGILIKALEKCSCASGSEGNIFMEIRLPFNSEITLLSWCLPVFKSVALICDSQTALSSTAHDNIENLTIENCSSVLYHLLKLCKVLPVGKELLALFITFKELASCNEGKRAFTSISKYFQSSTFEELEPQRGHASDWRKHPPLLHCWRNLLRSIEKKDGLSTYAFETVDALSFGVLRLCIDGKSLNVEAVSVLKFLFGLPFDFDKMEHFPEGNFKDVSELICLLDLMLVEDEYLASSNMKATLSQMKEMAKLLLALLQKRTSSTDLDDIACYEALTVINDVQNHTRDISSQLFFPSVTISSIVNYDSGPSFSRIKTSTGNAEKAEDFFSLGGLSDKFQWDCPDTLRDRLSAAAHPVKRKIPSIEVPSRRSRGDTPGPEPTGPNAFARGLGPLAFSSGLTRRDSFRQRKPNTSRPPSVHVDDYEARNIDGLSSGSIVVSSNQRGGSTGGRPPSIHVDEFMARQRQRQVPVAGAVSEMTPQVRNVPSSSDKDPQKVDRSHQLKTDIDDDLQGIDIVFDEECESDDKLPFPQLDDNIQPAPVIVEGSLPHSIVEETESEANGSGQNPNLGTPSKSNVDENTQSEFSSRSVSRPEKPLSREASISSERKYFGTANENQFFHEQSDDIKSVVPVMASGGYDSAPAANLSGMPAPFFKGSASSEQPISDSRMPPPTFYHRDSSQHASNFPLVSGSQGPYVQKLPSNQPPLPPGPPPPPKALRVHSQNAETGQSHSSPYGHSVRDVHPPVPPGYSSQAFEVSNSMTAPAYRGREDRSKLHHAGTGLYPPSTSSFVVSPNDPPLQSQADYLTKFNNTAPFPARPMLDSNYSWASTSSASKPPPLPPTPPPFSASAVNQSSTKGSMSQSSGYNQSIVGTGQLPMTSTSPSNDIRLGSFSAAGGNLSSYSPPQLVPVLPNTRPASIPVGLFSSPTQQAQNLPSISLSLSAPQPSIQPAQSSQLLQPLQPPHPQHLRPFIRSDPSLLQSPIQGHPFQMQQQPQISPNHIYYSQQQDHLPQSIQQQQVEHIQHQTLAQQRENAIQQQQDSGALLQQYFSSPEAIQSLLSDREKLCQLLEQHPKLMQMLQERLGHL